MLPSWEHFIPATLRMEKGISFDMMTYSSWRFNQHIGFVLHRDNISAPSFPIDGHKVFCMTCDIKATAEIQPTQLAAKIEKVKSTATSFSEQADELFVTGPIKSLGEKTAAIILIRTDGKRGISSTQKNDVIAFCETHNTPLLEMTSSEFYEIRKHQDGMSRYLESLSKNSTPERMST